MKYIIRLAVSSTVLEEIESALLKIIGPEDYEIYSDEK